jgi:uncharacterized membrane protein YhiD involved in acid resistance
MRRLAVPALVGALTFIVTADVHGQLTVPDSSAEAAMTSLGDELAMSATRLPLAALLGTGLALRPRRRGTPPRSMPVIETQIILAVVGALVMLVVGASLARAFGIVGAANLIRYRAKIDDPKDAVVMLSALGIGLASGVGLFGLAVFGTFFIGLSLWIIEGFEPKNVEHFELTIKVKKGAAELRPKIEKILSRHQVSYELRVSAEDEVSYAVDAPPDLAIDRVSNALTALAPDGTLAVEWDEKKSKGK